VKNVSMLCDDGVLRFPDAVTARGRRHLQVLADRARAGERAVLFLHIGHTGGRRVEPARDVDPAWADALREAMGAGVEVESWRVALTSEDAMLDAPVPFSLG
jgi:sugar fermentation stimulation protein A